MVKPVCLAGALVVLVLAPASVQAQVASRPAATEPVFTSSRGAFFALSVADLEAGTRWYRDTLGLRVVMTAPRRDGVAVVALEGGGLLVELIEHAAAKPGGPEAHLTHGFTKAGIIVDDFDRTVSALNARGIPIVMGPFPPRPAMRANLGIRDHAGNLIQIFGPYAR